ncbi:MAG: iron-sulfur cluster repair di-iron protein [Rubripirellula sp.]|nr:iron-sulfur cluster repair di-iron protein [Rubripirellula sp.]
MLTLDPQMTVGDFVRQRPSRARVFENLQIDYCCGGKLTLNHACEKRGMEVVDVLRQVEACDATTDSQEIVDADAMTMTELADHIESTHHAYLRSELPRLDAMTEKVTRVHGDKDKRLYRMRDAFVALKAELEPHMMKEERILFPIVRQLDASQSRPEFHCGNVANPIRQMEHEHEQAGLALATLNETTDGYTAPEWACNTHRALLDSLAKLEADMHQHIHKENNVLFPKAIQRNNESGLREI